MRLSEVIMSSVARWTYTAKATIWRVASENEFGTKTFHPPEYIDCNYGLDTKTAGLLSIGISGIGSEFSISNTFWTEYADASQGDFIIIGESSELDPIKAGASEIKHITRYADTFERLADDYALMTGV